MLWAVSSAPRGQLQTVFCFVLFFKSLSGRWGLGVGVEVAGVL